MDVLLHVENGRPKRPNTDNHGTYVEDGLWPSLSGSPWEDFFTSRMGRNKIGHRDVQWIDYGWVCATRVRKNVEAWKKVAERMDAGNFAIMGDPVKKCQVKGNNQLGKCKTYATLISQTGVGAEVLKEKPSFYDAMQMIIGKTNY